MTTVQPLGIPLLICGVILLGYAAHFSLLPVDQLFSTPAGRFTDRTLWYLLAGLTAVLGGAFLAVFGKQAG
jgi:hypothetical protein